MEQRDYLKDQIEQIGKALAKIISGFFGFKSNGFVTQGIEATNMKLKSELKIDIELILKSKSKRLHNYISSRKLTAEHIEILVDYIIEIGKSKLESEPKEALRIFNKVMEMLDVADEVSNAVSFERINKKKRVKKMLS